MRLAGLIEQTRPSGTDSYAAKHDVAVISMILLRQLARAPDYRKAFPEKEILGAALADHVACARDEEALLHSMDLVHSYCFGHKAAQLAFEKGKGIAALLRHIGSSERYV